METTEIPRSSFAFDTVFAQLENGLTPQGVVLDSEQYDLAQQVVKFLQEATSDDATQLGQVGYFVYGPPGRGKTWLMTQLFEAAPYPVGTKRQVHFHDFFRGLQRQLGAKTSTREAIEATLNELLTGTQLFFFDELHVHDPGSAALLNRLLAVIAKRGIPTLITSNYAPENLLQEPAFHHVIEPSITILREHFSVQALDGGTDYRSLHAARDSGFASGRWLVAEPGDHPYQVLRSAGYMPPRPTEATTVLEGHRALKALAVRDKEIWFDFADLLQARSVTSDFMDLTEDYDHWVLTGIPKLSQTDPASRQRFVTLIDVLVDRDIPLVACATVSRESLADMEEPPPDLFRTQSRLALLRGQ
ncbi:cell division protein ZapE [Enteractinococcus coprophilus]|uniref:Cell division protein ZapE n=1 Tax=Enteractinococcus coprophilus TaxID=1027633 RepID=A0A543A0I4_9MICC|nr:cell division protein ZapE [Enteractinococcus coprophilus]TQL66006.1 cell division protein ZapE [Enteractinococcus coprophilus]